MPGHRDIDGDALTSANWELAFSAAASAIGLEIGRGGVDSAGPVVAEVGVSGPAAVTSASGVLPPAAGVQLDSYSSSPPTPPSTLGVDSADDGDDNDDCMDSSSSDRGISGLPQHLQSKLLTCSF